MSARTKALLAIIEEARSDAQLLDGRDFYNAKFDQAVEAVNALAAEVAALRADLTEANERLAAYEEPGWISPIQKVQEQKKELRALRADREALREALRKMNGLLLAAHHVYCASLAVPSVDATAQAQGCTRGCQSYHAGCDYPDCVVPSVDATAEAKP